MLVVSSRATVLDNWPDTRRGSCCWLPVPGCESRLTCGRWAC